MPNFLIDYETWAFPIKIFDQKFLENVEKTKSEAENEVWTIKVKKAKVSLKFRCCSTAIRF